MAIINILLLLVFFFSSMIGGLLMFQGSREKSVILYGLIIFFTGLWTLSIFIANLPNISIALFKFGMVSQYIMGPLVYLLWFWFTIYFPKRDIKSLSFPAIITVLFVSMLAFIALRPSFFFDSLKQGGNLADSVVFNPWGYWILIIFLFFVLIWGMSILIRKISLFQEAERKRLIYFVSWTFFVGFFAIISVLIIPWFGFFSFVTINPLIFTTNLVGLGFYAVFSRSIFNVRAVTSELLIFLIWGLISARMFMDQNSRSILIDGTIIFSVFVLGIMIIKSAIKESRQKEILEEKVKERTKDLQSALDDVNKRKQDLEKFYGLTVGRELKMVELKQQIKELEDKFKNNKL